MHTARRDTRKHLAEMCPKMHTKIRQGHLWLNWRECTSDCECECECECECDWISTFILWVFTPYKTQHFQSCSYNDIRIAARLAFGNATNLLLPLPHGPRYRYVTRTWRIKKKQQDRYALF